MKKWICLSLLVLAGCAGTGSDGKSGAGARGDGGTQTSSPAKPDIRDEGTIEICRIAKAKSAIDRCISGWSENKKSALLATIEAWAVREKYFFPTDLDRESFKTRYQINDAQVVCLTERTCGVEYEDAL